MLRFNPRNAFLQPLDIRESYELDPRAIIKSHIDVGQVADEGNLQWSAIVTDISRGQEPDGSYVFSVVTGVAASHSQVSEAAGLENEHPKLRLPEIPRRDFYLRLESGKRRYGDTLHETLVAQMSFDNAKGVNRLGPNRNLRITVAALNIGASVLEAVRLLPCALERSFTLFELQTRAGLPPHAGSWQIQGNQACITRSH